MYGNPGTRVTDPGTRVRRTTPPFNRQHGSKQLQCMVTRVPLSALPVAAKTLKGDQIVYGNPGTLVCRDPGTRPRFQVHPSPPGRVPGSKF